MKTLADAAFFRAFDSLAGAGNPALKRLTWNFAGAVWRRERHSFAGADHSFAMEVFSVAYTGRPAWKLLVVREHWWATGERDAIKSVHWARPVSGRGADVLNWLRNQEKPAGRPSV